MYTFSIILLILILTVLKKIVIIIVIIIIILLSILFYLLMLNWEWFDLVGDRNLFVCDSAYLIIIIGMTTTWAYLDKKNIQKTSLVKYGSLTDRAAAVWSVCGSYFTKSKQNQISVWDLLQVVIIPCVFDQVQHNISCESNWLLVSGTMTWYEKYNVIKQAQIISVW